MVSVCPGWKVTLSFLFYLSTMFCFFSSVEKGPWIADVEQCQQTWMCYEPPVSIENESNFF